MSPYEIGILMHYYTTPLPYEGREPIAKGTLEDFIERGLLMHDNGYEGNRLCISPKGKVLCEALTSIPDPELTYRINWPERS